MTTKQIKDNAPDGATHFGVEYDEDGEFIIYLKSKPWGYHYMDDNLVDELEEHLLNIKPLK